MSKPSEAQGKAVRELANSTGVSESDVKKVLEGIGLDRVFSEVSNLGVDTSKITKDNFKLAVRLSKNTIPV